MAPQTTLEYGRASRVEVKKVLVWIAVGLLAMVAMLVSVKVAWDFVYYKELRQVRSRLEALPDVKIVNLGAHEDLTLEEIWATIQLKDDPGALIGFYAITPGSFEDAEHLYLTQLGPHTFSVATFGTFGGASIKTWGFRHWIDVGRSGDFAHLLPFELRNISDVLKHYDELVHILETWPHAPESARFTSPNGSEVRYTLNGSVWDAVQQEETMKLPLRNEPARRDDGKEE